MPRSASSSRWLQRQRSDIYVRKANVQNYRSRAAFKLLEIEEKHKIFQGAKVVVDLGAAPGSWSQVARELLPAAGKVIALDLLEIKPLPGVITLQGDFTAEKTYDQLLNLTNDVKVDLVISDLAPNLSGIASVDAPRAVYLAKRSMFFAQKVLRPSGKLLIKLFQGQGFSEFITLVNAQFGRVIIYKPKASRGSSKEVYCIASQLRVAE